MTERRFELEAAAVLARTRERYPWTVGVQASTIRGRAIRVGGVQQSDQGGGASGRTNPQTNATRPAFIIQAGYRKPTGGAGFATGGAGLPSWFDTSSVQFWRLVAVGLALAYVVGFHVSLNGVRLGIGPGR